MCTETFIWSCLHPQRQSIPCSQERQDARSRCFPLWLIGMRDVCRKGKTYYLRSKCPDCEEKDRRRKREERRVARQAARQTEEQQYWERTSLLGDTTPPPPLTPKDRKTVDSEDYRMSHLPLRDFSEFPRLPAALPRPNGLSQGRRKQRPPPLRTRSFDRELTDHET